MALACACSAALTGATGHVIEARAGLADDPAGMTPADLPETAWDRIRAAIVFPLKSACRTEQYRQRRP